MVRELVEDPLHQRVLDPACGSGTFLTEAVSHFIDAANNAHWEPAETLSRLRVSVIGIDVHPVAAHLARSAWTLAARPAIEAATKPKPRWDVHMAGDGDLDWGYAGTPLPLIAGWSGSGA